MIDTIHFVLKSLKRENSDDLIYINRALQGIGACKSAPCGNFLQKAAASFQTALELNPLHCKKMLFLFIYSQDYQA